MRHYIWPKNVGRRYDARFAKLAKTTFQVSNVDVFRIARLRKLDLVDVIILNCWIWKLRIVPVAVRGLWPDQSLQRNTRINSHMSVRFIRCLNS